MCFFFVFLFFILSCDCPSCLILIRGISMFLLIGSPRPDYRINIKTSYRLGNKEDMVITGTFIANPKPTISWMYREHVSSESVNLENNTGNFLYFIDTQHTIYTTRALRTQMKTENFGQYIVNTTNDVGYHVLVFSVFQQREYIIFPRMFII